MPHPWNDQILALASQLDGAEIPYSFEASTALLIQGVEAPWMDDIDISVPWDRLEAARQLLAADRPSPVQIHDGWAIFQLQRGGVPVDVLAYAGTDLGADPDRVAVPYCGRMLWCKSLAFFHRHSPPGHPRRELIERFWAGRQ